VWMRGLGWGDSELVPRSLWRLLVQFQRSIAGCEWISVESKVFLPKIVMTGCRGVPSTKERGEGCTPFMYELLSLN